MQVLCLLKRLQCLWWVLDRLLQGRCDYQYVQLNETKWGILAKKKYWFPMTFWHLQCKANQKKKKHIVFYDNKSLHFRVQLWPSSLHDSFEATHKQIRYCIRVRVRVRGKVRELILNSWRLYKIKETMIWGFKQQDVSRILCGLLSLLGNT